MTTMMYVAVFPPNPLPSQTDFPPKTSEIKPTGIEDAKVLNGTMDDSLQGRLVTPNCDDMVSLCFACNLLQHLFCYNTVPLSPEV